MTPFFFASNDELDLRRTLPSEIAFIGVASPHVVHALAMVLRRSRVTRCVIADVNARQLRHAKHFFGAVAEMQARCDYARHILAAEVDDDALHEIDGDPDRIQGSDTGGALFAYESAFWTRLRVDASRFKALYGVPVAVEPDGLRCALPAAPGAPPAQIVHAIACRPTDECLFHGTLAFGSGFLCSDNAYASFHEALGRLRIEYVCSDIAPFLEASAARAATLPLVAYCSNLFHPFFMSRSAMMQEKGARLIQRLYAAASNVTLIADEREGDALSEAAAAMLRACRHHDP